MTKLFQQIEELIPTLHGWCEVDKAHRLAACVLALQPDVVVEIGVWGGRSLFPMALACKALGKGMVIGIDPWEPQASVEGQGEADAKWWGEIPHAGVYANYLSNVHSLGLESFIRTVKSRSDNTEPPAVIDILHVDGNHGPQALNDCERFACRVRIGGLVCLDDLDWGVVHNVRKAEQHIFSLGFQMLYPLGTGAMYQRMR